MDSATQKQPVLLEKCGIKIPKLDFTSILMQRQVDSSQNDNEEESNSAASDESYYKEGKDEEQVD